MNKILLLVVLVLALSYQSTARVTKNYLEQKEWSKYKQEFKKVYESGEEVARFSAWKSNSEIIEKHNQEADVGKKSFRLKMNQFGDLTLEEFKKQVLNGYKPKKNSTPLKNKKFSLKDKVPGSIDWRTLGAVTSVKDQGQCGSCWAFSAIGSLEGQHYLTSGKLVTLSAQNLMDCSNSFGNMGCQGGLNEQAFAYIKANNGIDTEESYPYEGQDGTCRFNATNVGATDSGFNVITSGSEDELTAAVAFVGPIANAIDASHTSFQLYSSGVYYEPDCSSTELDHTLTVVGFGQSVDVGGYYIVKNSWGTSWGDQGYILMSKDMNNNCGIATEASYPTI